MKSVWIKIGRMIYWLTWPGIFVCLYFSKRTRVLIVAEEQILLGKTWLGSGNWHAIGGGLRMGEQPKSGAIREVYEETGIRIQEDQILELMSKRVVMENKLIVHYVGFVVELAKMPEIKRQKDEISDLQWFKLSEVKKCSIGGRTVSDLIAAWQAKLSSVKM